MKNEFIKIFKRKNIFILLCIGVILIITYNLFQKLIYLDVNIVQQYQRAYDCDKLFLENYEQLNIKEDYEDIVERIRLEKYAIDNNIEYNILLNSENSNAVLPVDARILLMRIFNKFDMIIVFIVIYLANTIILEEYNYGTIKYLLIKPHTRIKILWSKLLTSIFVTILVIIFIILFQYILGGLLFGFGSYRFEAIRYNRFTQEMEIMNLLNYVILIFLSKIPMYVLLIIISLIFSIITHNIALNILISLGLYIISTMEILMNNFSKYLFIYNWDISKYLFTDNRLIEQPIIISSISLLLLFLVLSYLVQNKDIRNE